MLNKRRKCPVLTLRALCLQQQGSGWGDDLKAEVSVQVGVDVLLVRRQWAVHWLDVSHRQGLYIQCGELHIVHTDLYCAETEVQDNRVLAFTSRLKRRDQSSVK